MSTLSLTRAVISSWAPQLNTSSWTQHRCQYNLRGETIAGDRLICAADVTLLPTIFLRNRDEVTEKIYATLKRRLRRR
jgi:hypothetical protein